MLPDPGVYLRFSVKILKLLNMWPREGLGLCLFIKQYYVVAIITLTILPTAAALLTQIKEETTSFSAISESIIALAVLLGFSYISICFLQSRNTIKTLVEDLIQFEQFSTMSLVISTERRAEFCTKLFTIYGLMGNLCYNALPLLNYNDCVKNRTHFMKRYGIPCGLATPLVLPFRYDESPLREFWIVTMILVCTTTTAIVVTITMLLCGILMYVTSNLRRLQSVIHDLSSYSGHEFVRQLRTCVQFHIAILNYSKRTELCFSKIMLLHITGTSFIISILGFEIIMTDDMSNVVRYGMHLFGWMCLLGVVCYFGQTLMDESVQVSRAVYNIAWYDKPISVQKVVYLMLIRSQKPLKISALGLKVMSFSTFIWVLYSSYSYFTLLLELKL